MCQKEENIKKEILKLDNTADKLVDFVVGWVQSHVNSCMLFAQKNKEEDLMVALVSNDTIYLFSKRCMSVMYAPRLTFSILNTTHLHIDDIVAKTNNIGNGSILMQALLQYVIKRNITLITGDISPIDYDHLDRLRHYYQKFGFVFNDRCIRKEM